MPSFSGNWSMNQQFQGRGQQLWINAPGIPTIGTATAGNCACASVTFTPPNCLGYPVPTYVVTSTPGCITATGAASPITVTGLTIGTSYTFKAKATNSVGTSACSAASNSITAQAVGSASYTTPGTYSWVAPTGVTSVSVVAVGGGGDGSSPNSGGGGGGLGYKNNIAVTPGNSYTVVVGPQENATGSYFINTSTVNGKGTTTSTGGTYVGDGGGNGGTGNGGGGGAGGYSGNGGTGGAPGSPAGAGSGGGGGGARGYICPYYCGSTTYGGGGGGGGGVGLFGEGTSGAAGGVATYCRPRGGGGGSGGATGCSGCAQACPPPCFLYSYGGNGGLYGGGGGGAGNGQGAGASGAVRILWPGNTRSFPSTNVGSP